MPFSRRPKQMLSGTVSQQNSVQLWNTMPRSAPGPVTGAPSSSTRSARRARDDPQQRRLAASGLPGAFYALRETKLPPIASLRASGVAMAVATDCNPGTSPSTSLVLMLNMACTLFRLTSAEALAGATRHAARALGLADRRTLDAGQRADIALWDIAEPAELAYWIGARPCAGVVRAGVAQRMRFG